MRENPPRHCADADNADRAAGLASAQGHNAYAGQVLANDEAFVAGVPVTAYPTASQQKR